MAIVQGRETAGAAGQAPGIASHRRHMQAVEAVVSCTSSEAVVTADSPDVASRILAADRTAAAESCSSAAAAAAIVVAAHPNAVIRTYFVVVAGAAGAAGSRVEEIRSGVEGREDLGDRAISHLATKVVVRVDSLVPVGVQNQGWLAPTERIYS